MATFSKEISSYYGLTCRVTWSETISVAENNSTVSVTKIELSSNEMSGTFYATGYITINSVKVSSFSGKAFYVNGSASYYSTLSGATGSGTVSHNDDGTASTTISVTITDIQGFSNWSTASVSQSVTLTKINRGIVYIGNGSTVEGYQVYIGNGSSWELHCPYVGNGSTYDICT